MTTSNCSVSKLEGDSKTIVTNQMGMHDKLAAVVRKHLSHEFQKPFQQHTEQAFNDINTRVKKFLAKNKLAQNKEGEIILDACCGVGQSTRLLAQQNPHALVIGVDKSAHRLARNVTELSHTNDLTRVDNFQLVRADLNDFYRLVNAANWPVIKHYILYPNPWPKSKHLQRRWHGSAVFPQMISIGQQMILRSNWRLYLEEFQAALSMAGRESELTEVKVSEQALTPFEAKYQSSGQRCWQLLTLT